MLSLLLRKQTMRVCAYVRVCACVIVNVFCDSYARMLICALVRTV